jgi:hypothetical protein
MFRPDHYNRRANELEEEAKRARDADIRAGYLDLARAFREMANLASLAQNAADDDEAIHLAERMVGKDPRPY